MSITSLVRTVVVIGQPPAQKIEELVGLETAPGQVGGADELYVSCIAPSRGKKIEQLLGSARRSEDTQKEQARICAGCWRVWPAASGRIPR